MLRLLFLLTLLCLPVAAPLHAASLDDYGEVPDFDLTERSGRTVRRDDLLGRVWIASFVFTRCSGPCPQVTRTMERLQGELARFPSVRLVTFTVDPREDDPETLSKYANDHHADPERWLFLTGTEEKIYGLLRNGFHIFVEPTTGADRKPGREVAHDTRLFVIDRQGHIRGSFDGLPNTFLPEPERDLEYERSLRELRRRVADLEYDAWYIPRDFPRFNATLNAVSTALLLLGFIAIRRRLVGLHIACMVSAFLVSTVFLASYLFYHLVIRQGQPTSFASQTDHAHPPAWVAYAYYTTLLSHMVLASAAAPLALVTLYLGLSRRWRWHLRVARWTLPIWLYVSVTGVVVYWMLYRLYPAP